MSINYFTKLFEEAYNDYQGDSEVEPTRKVRHLITIDPGIDDPDLYIHPEKYIDEEVLPIVLNLWKHKIKTWESGGDKDITEQIEDSDFNTPKEWMKDAISQGYVKREYIKNNRLREKAFIIINKKDLPKAKKLLPNNIEIETGTGGFTPEEYNSNVPPYKELIYIQWKM